MVRAMQVSHQIPDLAVIPTDSRQRDGLVVYCGVASDAERQHITEFCWGIIHVGLANLSAEVTDAGRQAIHCLRFLSDAFRSDHRALSQFQEELSDRIIDLLSSQDLLAAKIAAEAIPLIIPGRRSEAIEMAFRTGSAWVCKTALGSCRHLADIGEDAQRVIRYYIRSLRTLELIASFRDLAFSLSLSDSLRVQKRALHADAIQLAALVPWFLVTIYLLASRNPVHYAIIAISFIFLYTWHELIEDRTRAMSIIARDGLEAGLRYALLFVLWFMLATGPFYRWTETNMTITLILIGIGLPIWLPWEAWSAIVRTLRTPLELIREALSVMGRLLFFMVFGAIFVYLNLLLPDPYKQLLEWILPLVVKLGMGAVFIWIGIWFLHKVWDRWHDRRRLHLLGCPERVTRDLVLQCCQELRTGYGRVRYLEMLRINRVPVEGSASSMLPVSKGENRVREEWARLEEQWQQLIN